MPLCTTNQNSQCVTEMQIFSFNSKCYTKVLHQDLKPLVFMKAVTQPDEAQFILNSQYEVQRDEKDKTMKTPKNKISEQWKLYKRPNRKSFSFLQRRNSPTRSATRKGLKDHRSQLICRTGCFACKTVTSRQLCAIYTTAESAGTRD